MRRALRKAAADMNNSQLAMELCSLTVLLNFGEIGTNPASSARIRELIIEAANRLETSPDTGRRYDDRGYLMSGGETET